jgi:tricorn protease
MKKLALLSTLTSIALIILNLSSMAVNTLDTRMMHQPAISASHIAFIYANDLWVANADGSNARRLTSDAGIESGPHFSPDGRIIAFNAEYDGNTDVFTIPVEGGIPQRLTWHPSADMVRGFTPDGKAILFASPREDFSMRYLQLYTVPVTGGFPTKLVIPNAHQAAYSPDGRKMAYTPLSPRFQQWKNYRGGTVSNIWVFDFKSHETLKIPEAEGRSNDWNPMWAGNLIYFLSDRNGEFNLFSYHTENKTITQLTHFEDFPVNSATLHGGKIIFEQEGKLHVFDTASGNYNTLKIGIAAELSELRPRFIKGVQNIRSAHISPSGNRAVFGFRGDIITVPAEKGDPRNITETTGTHEKYPSWSPDGKHIAYFSDETGEYKLHIKPQDGKGDSRTIAINGTGFYAFPEWSPDSKYITCTDNGRNFYLIDVSTGTVKKIDADDMYIPGPVQEHSRKLVIRFPLGCLHQGNLYPFQTSVYLFG